MTPVRDTPLQKYQLEQLTECLRNYLKAIMPEGARHRKTTIVVVGDRYRVDDISCRFVVSKK